MTPSAHQFSSNESLRRLDNLRYTFAPITPLPSLPCRRQAGFHWVIQNVFHYSIKLRVVAHNVIVAFPLPECPPASNHVIRFPRRVTLERLHNSVQWRILADETQSFGKQYLSQFFRRQKRSKYCVNMVRHYAVGFEAINISITIM